MSTPAVTTGGTDQMSITDLIDAARAAGAQRDRLYATSDETVGARMAAVAGAHATDRAVVDFLAGKRDQLAEALADYDKVQAVRQDKLTKLYAKANDGKVPYEEPDNLARECIQSEADIADTLVRLLRVEYDTTSSVSRQHHIDTGSYLPVGEAAV